MRWEVTGADMQTGSDQVVVIDADDEASARRRAGRRGLVVERVKQLGAAVGVAPDQLPVVRLTDAVAVQVAPARSAAEHPWVAFVGDGQDPVIVAKLYGQLLTVMTDQESLVALVVQKKPLVNVSPDALAATSRRVILYRTKMLGGMTMDDFLWPKLSDARISEGFLGATITFSVVGGAPVRIDHLPKAQARAFYRFAQQQEEAALVVRRQQGLEEARAASGAVTVNNLTQPIAGGSPTQAAPPAADLASRLRSLKGLLEAGLIEQAEFDSKKAEMLKSL